MSTVHSAVETYPCADQACDEHFAAHDSVDGSYCSQTCSYRDDGRSILRNIAHDHRYCTSCFRQVKEIERPQEHQRVVVGPVDHDQLQATSQDVLVGYQYRTKHSDIGPKETRAHHIIDAQPDTHDRKPTPADSLTMTGTICACGTTDHRDDYLRTHDHVDIPQAARRLHSILEDHYHDGQLDTQPDSAQLVQALLDSLDDDTPDWAAAIGAALD